MKLSKLTDKLQEVAHEGHAEKQVVFAVQNFYKRGSYELIETDNVEVTTEDGKVRVVIRRN